jgi:uncharacterized protein (TIGR00255 family)
MMIKSMTAFARKQQQQETGTITWEVRSVNSRYLDINFRLPEMFRELEPALREIVGKYLRRGKVDVSLRFRSDGNANGDEIKINQTEAGKLRDALRQIKNIVGEDASISAVEILRWPGVMQIIEGDRKGAFKEALSLFEEDLQELNKAREREGEKLGLFMEQRLEKILAEVAGVKKQLPSILQKQREVLFERFETAKIELDPNRLEQEMVLLAQRADVDEEIDRLEAHVVEVRRILKEGGEVGRRLDFLLQEMNREANTLGSKSISEITTRAAIELKVLVEQVREQVQNVE